MYKKNCWTCRAVILLIRKKSVLHVQSCFFFLPIRSIVGVASLLALAKCIYYFRQEKRPWQRGARTDGCIRRLLIFLLHLSTTSIIFCVTKFQVSLHVCHSHIIFKQRSAAFGVWSYSKKARRTTTTIRSISGIVKDIQEEAPNRLTISVNSYEKDLHVSM